MKAKANRFRTALPIVPLVITLAGQAIATPINKLSTGTDLNDGASWDGGNVPGSTDVATWGATSLGPGLTIGSSLTWQGINVSGASADINVTTSNTTNRLTLGSSGITLTGSRNLTLGANLGFNANQTWSVDGGRSLVLIGASRNANGTGDIDIVQTGSGVANVRMSQNGNNANWNNFSGNITVNSNVKVQSEGNAAAAFGTGIITLNGGQIAQNNGNWTWSNDISVTAGSTIGNDSSSGLGRTLKLLGTLTSSNSSGLTFTNNTGGGTRTDNVGFLLAGVNASTYTTTTISANSRVRVGGNATASVGGDGLDAGNRGSLGTGDVTLSATSSELAFTRNDAHTVANTISGSGTVVIGGNTSQLVGTATQVVTLSGANDYTGSTRVSRSRLNLTGSLTSAITVDNAGSISGTGSTTDSLTLASTGNIALSGGATTTSLTTNGATFSGSNQVFFVSDPVPSTVYDVVTYGAGGVTGFGNLTAASRGTLADTGTKITFTAGDAGTRTWTADSGTWAVATPGNWSGGDNLFYNGDTAIFNNPSATSTVTLSGVIRPAAVNVTNTNTYIFTGTALDGTGTLAKSGTGTLTLQSANSYSGGTTLNAGTLQVENNTGLGSGALTINAGTLTTAAFERQLANNIVLDGDAILTGTAIAQGMRLNGLISGNGGITKEGSGRVTLANDSNSFTGTATLNAGILATSLDALSASSSVTLGATGSLAIGTNGTTTINNLSGVAGAIIRSDFNLDSPDGGRTLQVNQTTDGTYAGTFTQGGNRPISLIKSGASTLTLTGTGTFTGSTTLSGGTLRIGGAGLLGAANYAGAITNNATLHVDSTANQTLSGTITGSGDLLKSNTGTLTLFGNASGFTGDTTVSGGRLVLNGSISGDVTVQTGASIGGTGTGAGTLTMEEGSSFAITGGTPGLPTVFDEVVIGDQVFIDFTSAPIEGETYEVVEYGDGGLTGLANLVPMVRGSIDNDTINKVVTLTPGASATRTWNTGDGVWNSLGLLENWLEGDKFFFQGDDVIFGDIASDTTITLEGQLAPFSLEVINTANTYTFTGTGGLSGDFFFDKFGAGTLQIANPNPNMSGSTLIDEGVFRFIDGGTWGTGGFINDGSLEIDQSTNLTLAGNISGNGPLSKSGSGILTLGGASSYDGGTTLDGGLIRLENNSALGFGTLTVNNGTLGRNAARAIANDIDIPGTLSLGGTGQSTGNLTLSGTLSGDGTLTNISGITILTGTNTFSGTIEVQGTPAEGFDVVLNSAGSVDGAPNLHMTGGRFILAVPFVGESATIGNLTGTGGIINPQFGGDTGVRTLQVDQTANGEFAGNIQDGGGGRLVGLTKTGSANLTLTGANNTYTGPTTITAGTLALGISNVLATTPVSIGNATLAVAAGVSDSVGTLQPTAAATINLGSGGTLAFAASDAIDWSGGTLEITGDFVPGSSLRFGTDDTGLTATQLAQISAPSISSFALDADGFLIESTGSPFDTWAAANGLDGTPGKEAGFDDDPDGDGVANGLEWILGGNPLDGQSGTLVTTTASAAGGLTLSFTRNEDSIGEATLTVEYNTDLGAAWESVTIGANSSGPDANDVTVDIDTAPTPHEVTVNIPASNAPGGKLFARIKATQP